MDSGKTDNEAPKHQTREFDGFNQLRRLRNNDKVNHYQYDALGRRSAKLTEQGKTDYLWDGDQLIGEHHQGKFRWYIYQPNTFLPIALVEEGQVYHYHLDHLGTPIKLTDNQVQTAWQADYSAFGEAQVTIEQVNNPIRFQGQYFDQESGLHYNRFRYYDPEIGRFIHQDPIGLVGSLNHYQYAPNPVEWVDPFGLLCKEGQEKLDRMLTSLVSSNGIDEGTKDIILQAATDNTVVGNSDKSILKYKPQDGVYRKEYEYDITGLDEERNLVTLNKINKSGKIISETVSIDKFAEQHIINGRKVEVDLNAKPTKYHKRTVGEVQKARKEFAPVRREYISNYANEALSDENHVAHRYFDNKQLQIMSIRGDVPVGYNVHHKKPIFRCIKTENPNSMDNLEILPEEFHNDFNKELHWYDEGNEPYNEDGLGPRLGSLTFN